MLKNYLKIAWRSLWKNKFYTAINIGGLAVGLSAGIMLLLWAENELSYDTFNKDYRHIYQLSAHFKSGADDITWNGVPGPLAVLAKSIPQVISVVRINAESGQLLSDKNKKIVFDNNTTAFVDSGFFSLFTLRLLKGNSATIFPNNNSVVITASTARKFFGNGEAMGKTISYYKNDFTVTGVLSDFPQNSSIRYDALFPMGFYAAEFTAGGGNGDWKTIDEDMGNYYFNTFVKLQPNASAAQTGRMFSDAYKKARNGDSETSFQLQNLADIHLISADGNSASLRMVQIFLLVVVLLLLIASINYVNLSTARSLARAKEVSIRKVTGAKKGQLFLQFIVETLVLFGFATVAAIFLIILLMPLYNNLSGKALAFSLLDVAVWRTVGLALLGTLAASAIYPAIVLSSFRPIEALKGKVSTGIGVAAFRKALVVLQFAISVILIVCTIIMSGQMKFIKQKDPGYDRSYVFTVPLPQEAADHADAVKAELRKEASILSVATSDAYNIADIGSSTGDIYWKTKSPENNMIITQVNADKDFISTLKFKFIEGTNFSGAPADSAYYILNESAVREMGLQPPYVGQEIGFHSWKGTIRGVLKDFNFKSLKEKITPLLFYSRWKGNVLYIRTTAGRAQQAIGAAEKQYKKYGGDRPFGYSFLDKSFEEQYRSERRTGTLFNVFAAIAIFISCLGLFGLATYTAQVKTKEIGIRKVLGASVSGIVTLISKDFLKPVIIAIVLATPVAWWAMNGWLQGFAYRMHISWWIFVLAGAIAIIIALLTVSFQAVKAAMANPVKSLRME